MPHLHVTGPQYLEVEGSSVDTPAFWPLDYTPLRQAATQVGEDVELSKGQVIGLPRYATSTVIDLPMVISGEFTTGGVPYTDTKAGMDNNLAELNNLVGTPVTTGDGARALVHHLPGGGERLARAHTQLLLGERVIDVLFAVLSLEILGGAWTVVV